MSSRVKGICNVSRLEKTCENVWKNKESKIDPYNVQRRTSYIWSLRFCASRRARRTGASNFGPVGPQTGHQFQCTLQEANQPELLSRGWRHWVALKLQDPDCLSGWPPVFQLIAQCGRNAVNLSYWGVNGSVLRNIYQQQKLFLASNSCGGICCNASAAARPLPQHRIASPYQCRCQGLQQR